MIIPFGYHVPWWSLDMDFIGLSSSHASWNPRLLQQSGEFLPASSARPFPESFQKPKTALDGPVIWSAEWKPSSSFRSKYQSNRNIVSLKDSNQHNLMKSIDYESSICAKSWSGCCVDLVDHQNGRTCSLEALDNHIVPSTLARLLAP